MPNASEGPTKIHARDLLVAVLYQPLERRDGDTPLKWLLDFGVHPSRFFSRLLTFLQGNFPPEASTWEHILSKHPTVFISYSHADKRMVNSITKRLITEGIHVWLDEAELRHGDSLIGRLRAAIDSADVLVAVVSNNSVNSSWVQREIEVAMTQEIKQKRVKVIPVLTHSVQLPGFLEGKLYADFTTQYRRRKNIDMLIHSIRSHANVTMS